MFVNCLGDRFRDLSVSVTISPYSLDPAISLDFYTLLRISLNTLPINPIKFKCHNLHFVFFYFFRLVFISDWGILIQNLINKVLVWSTIRLNLRSDTFCLGNIILPSIWVISEERIFFCPPHVMLHNGCKQTQSRVPRRVSSVYPESCKKCGTA